VREVGIRRSGESSPVLTSRDGAIYDALWKKHRTDTPEGIGSLRNEKVVTMNTRLSLLSAAGALAVAMAAAQPASAAVFEFSTLADPNGSAGGSNEGTWDTFPDTHTGYAGSFAGGVWTVDGIGVKASATNDASPGSTYDGASEAYLDGWSGGPAGLGVCSTVNATSHQCGTGSDDNTGFAGDLANPGVLETLILTFDTAVVLTDLTFRDRDHGEITDGTWAINVNGADTTLSALDGAFGDFGGSLVGTTFKFTKTVDGGGDFYLDTAAVNAVPLPAAAWFLLTAVGGLFGARWLKRDTNVQAAA